MLDLQLIACQCVEDKLGLGEEVNDLGRWAVNMYKAITLLDADRDDLLNLILRKF